MSKTVLENESYMARTAVVEGFRSPFCKEGSNLKNVPPEFLGAMMISEMIQRMKNMGADPKLVDFVIGSNVATPAHAPNIARVAAVKGGLDPSIPADTIGKNCGSGIAAVNYGDLLIKAGRAHTIVVVGVELMSQIPLIYQDIIKKDFALLARPLPATAKVKLTLSLYSKLLRFWMKEYSPKVGLLLGLTDPICDLIMGLTAENLAKDSSFGITREDQDRFAVLSHRKASQAQKLLAQEIHSLYLPDKNKYSYIYSDNGVHKDASLEVFAKAKPFFDRRYGTVTAANSSQITDGAACILLMDEHKAKDLGLPVLGYIVDYCDVGFDPTRMGLAPVAAIAKLLKQAGQTLKDMSVVEINEAFAAQTLACTRVMSSNTLMDKFFSSYRLGNAPGEISESQLNPNGGAIALGHPVGVSGLRLIITALKELGRRNTEQALVSACIGGGQANAMILERSQS